jgi:uncharacterized protein Yka (UPF0111/DUF47 family)
MFGRLMPREGKYFDLFNSHAALIALGGTALSNMIGALVDHPEKAPLYAEEIDTLERKADAITHDTLAQLHTAFITPFDRDEIHQLINGMDDILDIMQDVAESMSLYDINRVPPEAKAMAVVTENCCVCVQSVVKLLHSMDNAPAILKLCHEINGGVRSRSFAPCCHVKNFPRRAGCSRGRQAQGNLRTARIGDRSLQGCGQHHRGHRP